MRGEVLYNVFLDEGDTEVRVVDGFDFVTDSRDWTGRSEGGLR